MASGCNECNRWRQKHDRIFAEVRRQSERIAELEGFALELLKLSDFRDDIDGGDFQDLAIRYGVLKGVEVTEPCGPMCNCAEFFGSDDFPQMCYRSTLKEQNK